MSNQTSSKQGLEKPIHNVFKDTQEDKEINLNRRQFVQGVSASAVAVGLAACGGSDSSGGSGTTSGDFSFKHGVASGDPLASAVILWTRVTPESGQSNAGVTWQIAIDEAFTRVVKDGVVTTNASKDFTVKVDATGLSADTNYFYRFMIGDTTSPVGKTKTLPTGSVDQVRFAVFSCANYPAGYFNVYAEAAKRADFDVSIHLGDFIYEYGRTDIQKDRQGNIILDPNTGEPLVGDAYASENAATLDREVLPEGETISKDQYRARYAQYLTDPDLQALQAAAPMIAVWDDHEIANDAYIDGAENHDDSEGDYNEREMTAMMVWHEWMPTRTPAVNIIYRQFDFGNLVSLHMLDTRVYGRDKQLDYVDYFTADGGIDAARFTAALSDQNRQLLGGVQAGYLQTNMASSTATWQILGQQVLMGRMNIPAPILLNFFNPQAGVTVDQYAALTQKAQQAPETLTDEEKAVLAQPKIPYNLDAWDGYAYAREVVLGTARQLNKNLVVLAGDTHNAWANDLKDIDGNQVGVEFATSSVTSPGFEEYLSNTNPQFLSAALPQLVDDLQYADTYQRGYIHLTVKQQTCQSDWIYVDKIDATDYTAVVGNSMQVKSGAGNRKLEQI